jgi:mono/diheme cytochrome c family protein
MQYPAIATRRMLAPLVAAAGMAVSGISVAGGPQEDYILYCMGCHGPTGHGVPGKVPPLAGSLALFMRSAEGREYLLRVPGAANSPVSDAQLAEVLNWAAHRFGDVQAGDAAQPFTALEVSANRHRPMADVKERRRAVIAGLRTSGPAPPDAY